MKILITGGCGFLGSNLAAKAIEQKDTVYIFDNLSREGSINNLTWLKSLGKITYAHGDIRNINEIYRCINSFKPDVIFHLAGQVAMTTSIDDPASDHAINTTGTVNLLEAARQSTPDAIIIYSSTNKVYGDLHQYTYTETESRYICNEQPKGFNEDTPLSFSSPYGCSKGAADQYMLDYARIFGLKTIVFRHSSMYGGRQYATTDQGWLGWFCQKAIEKYKDRSAQPFSISGNGKQVRDVLHAEDMRTLYFNAVNHIDKAQGQVFNIGGGFNKSLSLLELFNMLEENLDIKMNYKALPERPSDQRVFIADISKAKRLLNWSPTVQPDVGVKDMIEWITQQQ